MEKSRKTISCRETAKRASQPESRRWSLTAQIRLSASAAARIASHSQGERTARAARSAALELYGGFLEKQRRAAEAVQYLDRARPIRARLVRELNQRRQDSAGAGSAVKIAKGIEPPTLLRKVEPKYSDLARIARHQGTVVLMIEIGADGSVQDAQLVKGLGYGLDEEAVQAVRQWVFKPGLKDGQPVAVLATIEINFRLL